MPNWIAVPVIRVILWLNFDDRHRIAMIATKMTSRVHPVRNMILQPLEPVARTATHLLPGNRQPLGIMIVNFLFFPVSTPVNGMIAQPAISIPQLTVILPV